MYSIALCKIGARIPLACDERVQRTHAVRASATDAQILQRVVNERAHPCTGVAREPLNDILPDLHKAASERQELVDFLDGLFGDCLHGNYEEVLGSYEVSAARTQVDVWNAELAQVRDNVCVDKAPCCTS